MQAEKANAGGDEKYEFSKYLWPYLAILFSGWSNNDNYNFITDFGI